MGTIARPSERSLGRSFDMGEAATDPCAPPELEGKALRVAAELSERWRGSDGVLVHVLDNGGSPRSMDALRAYTHMTGAQLWGRIGQPNASVPSGDRLSASVINREHAATFEPGALFASRPRRSLLHRIGVSLTDYRHMPMVVLNASAAAARLSCCWPYDRGTNALRCATPGGGGTLCIPGCRQAGRRSDLAPSSGGQAGGDTARLASCLAATTGKYNEVVLDTWRDGGWGRGPALRRWVLAIAIHVLASNTTWALARAVRAAACSNGLPLPLLMYDPRAAASPFSVCY